VQTLNQFLMKFFYISKKYVVVSVSITFAIVMVQCSKSQNNSTATVCTSDYSFSKNIKPILDLNCNYAGCHDDLTITALSSYQTVHDGAAQIKTSIVAGRMPKGKTLSASDKNAIFCWIDSGAKNN
jgi:hypothetical protein